MGLSFSARINRVKNPNGPTKAFAILVVNDLIEIDGFRVVEGPKGLFVGVPNEPGKTPKEDGSTQYFDKVRFLDANEKGFSETRDLIQQTILEVYSEGSTDSVRGNAAAAQTDAPKPTGKRPGMARAASW